MATTSFVKTYTQNVRASQARQCVRSEKDMFLAKGERLGRVEAEKVHVPFLMAPARQVINAVRMQQQHYKTSKTAQVSKSSRTIIQCDE